MSIQANLKELLLDIPENVKLIAVSKYHPNESIMEAYEVGQRIFAESKAQEMSKKYDTLPKARTDSYVGTISGFCWVQ